MLRYLILGLIFLFTGCASIVSKSDYPVSFTTYPSATMRIYDLKNGNLVYEGKTPTTVTLKASGGFFSPAKYNVEFLFPGGKSRNITLSATLDGWYLGNLLFGGVIGMLIVDPATGAMWKLPTNISVNLKAPISELIFNGKKLKIVLMNDIPKNIINSLDRIY